MKFIKLSLLSLAVAALSTSNAIAQDKNLDTLQRMGNTATNMVIPTVPQEGKNADAIRANLKKVKLPDGFKIDLYAVVPDARYMAVAPSTNMLFVGTRKTTVWAVTNRNNGDSATEVKQFAPSIKFSNPNGVCFTKDGFLIVAESNRILHFPAAEYFYEGPDVAVAGGGDGTDARPHGQDGVERRVPGQHGQVGGKETTSGVVSRKRLPTSFLFALQATLRRGRPVGLRVA